MGPTSVGDDLPVGASLDIGRKPRDCPCISLAARTDLVRRAFRLEWFTAGWMLIEAAVAIGSGLAAHSLSLIAFGVDSLIELTSAGVLLWRLNVEMRQGAEFPHDVEQRASRISGALLFALVDKINQKSPTTLQLAASSVNPAYVSTRSSCEPDGMDQ